MRLIKGQGSEKTGACWMSAINWYVDKDKDTFSWSDHPECVDRVISKLGIYLNDICCTDRERETMIGPHLFDPIGTNKTYKLSMQRATRCLEIMQGNAGYYSKALSYMKEGMYGAVASIVANFIWTSTKTEKEESAAKKKILSLILELCEMGKDEVTSCMTKKALEKCVDGKEFVN